jgi:4-hydroxy-3-methylbut-2-enyl diphosphate reductase IspH
MMSKLAYLTAVLLVLPAPALAQIVFQEAPAVAPATNADKSKSDMDKLVCRSQETLGSRLDRKQVCMTKQQWQSAEQEAKNKVREMQIIGDTQSSH